MNRIRILADDALSVCVDDVAQSRRLADGLRRSGQWEEVVPGLDTFVVTFCPATRSLDEAVKLLKEQLSVDLPPPHRDPQTFSIPVQYGGELGPDLESVCAAVGMTQDAFIRYHTSAPFPVELLGFTPGFAYVGGLDERFDIARLDTPRRFVEAGSIGIANRRTGLYAMPGPGGWPLIGRTETLLFDPEATTPFRIHAGDSIHFISVEPT